MRHVSCRWQESARLCLGVPFCACSGVLASGCVFLERGRKSLPYFYVLVTSNRTVLFRNAAREGGRSVHGGRWSGEGEMLCRLDGTPVFLSSRKGRRRRRLS
ncbi:unnamed protein product, partial [Hapterophycus canaliculatus]